MLKFKKFFNKFLKIVQVKDSQMLNEPTHLFALLLGATQLCLGVTFWFCTQYLLLLVLRTLYGMLEIEPGLTTRKASSLPILLSLWPLPHSTVVHRENEGIGGIKWWHPLILDYGAKIKEWIRAVWENG